MRQDTMHIPYNIGQLLFPSIEYGLPKADLPCKKAIACDLVLHIQTIL